MSQILLGYFKREKNNSYNEEERNDAYASFLLPFCGGYFMKESAFQKELIIEIKKRFPGSIVMKNDPTYIQGIPDLLILYKNKWAALECKNSKNAKKQPNQEYYVGKMKDMSYSSFIFPENREEVLNELQRTFSI